MLIMVAVEGSINKGLPAVGVGDAHAGQINQGPLNRSPTVLDKSTLPPPSQPRKVHLNLARHV